MCPLSILMGQIAILARDTEVRMLRRVFDITVTLASGGFILLNLTFGHAAGGVSLGGEDVVSSYSSQSHRALNSSGAANFVLLASEMRDMHVVCIYVIPRT
jgi:hypothetical protein